jgi:formylglycine-generating enzyme required for sulfatase activity
MKQTGRATLVFLIGALAVMAAAATAGEGPRPGERLRDCGACPEMTVLPAATFLMGSPDDEHGRDPDEGPMHIVDMRQHRLAMGTYPVTVGQYRAFVLATGHEGTDDWIEPFGTAHRPSDDEPVVRVSWNDAVAYASWLARLTARPYRLPSEIEWEYAARGGATTAFPWGGNPDPGLANSGQPICCHGAVVGPDAWHYTSPVGSFPPNGFGLHDIAGNVHQWTADCWQDDYSGRGTAPREAAVDGDCAYRVVRGASWVRPPSAMRVAARNGLTPATTSPDIGFRISLDLDAPSATAPDR